MASRDPKVDLIASVPMFQGLGRNELVEIARLVDDVDIPAGKVLMRQGESGAEMFIIAAGSVRIERNGEFIRDAGPGTSIGEMALLSEGPRTATVTATVPTRILLAGTASSTSSWSSTPRSPLRSWVDWRPRSGCSTRPASTDSAPRFGPATRSRAIAGRGRRKWVLTDAYSQ